jgi:hypothetical protein
MVRQGMKKGAIFEDGGLFYIVRQVMDDGNYVSQHISREKKEELETKKTETKKPQKKQTKKEVV